jgi:hypothetical protein
MKTITDPELAFDVNQILKEVGSRIRSKRRLVYKNYEDFARIHKFNKVTVARIETGSNSSLKAIIMVSRALDIPIEELFTGIQ